MLFLEAALVILIINGGLLISEYLKTKPPPTHSDTGMTIREQFDTWSQGRTTYRFDHNHNITKIEAKVPPEGGRAVVFKTAVSGKALANRKGQQDYD